MTAADIAAVDSGEVAGACHPAERPSGGGLAHLWNRCCRGPAAAPELTCGESVAVAPARTAGPAWPSTPTSASTASSSKGFGAVTDPGLVDAPAADCDALGLLESDAGAPGR